MKNSTVRNKFRFINKTKEISNYRGDFLEDGLIEIKYRFEKQSNYITPILWDSLDYADISTTQHTFNHTVCDTKFCYSEPMATNSVANDLGITVPGKTTRQYFAEGCIGEMELTSHNIIIQLKGKLKSKIKTKRKRITRPITVKTKVKCNTCGRRWKSHMKYCGNCSTYLH